MARSCSTRFMSSNLRSPRFLHKLILPPPSLIAHPSSLIPHLPLAFVGRVPRRGAPPRLCSRESHSRAPSPTVERATCPDPPRFLIGVPTSGSCPFAFSAPKAFGAVGRVPRRGAPPLAFVAANLIRGPFPPRGTGYLPRPTPIPYRGSYIGVPPVRLLRPLVAANLIRGPLPIVERATCPDSESGSCPFAPSCPPKATLTPLRSFTWRPPSVAAVCDRRTGPALICHSEPAERAEPSNGPSVPLQRRYAALTCSCGRSSSTAAAAGTRQEIDLPDPLGSHIGKHSVVQFANRLEALKVACPCYGNRILQVFLRLASDQLLARRDSFGRLQ